MLFTGIFCIDHHQHSDIKLENVVLTEQFYAKLVDFGLAFEFPANAPTSYLGIPTGTHVYLAPECWTGLYSTASDMWALGVLLSYLLFLVPPYFDSENERPCALSVSATPTNRKNNVQLEKLYPFTSLNPVRFKKRHVSSECKDFMQRLFRKRSCERLTAEDALKHPWLTKYSNVGLVE